MNPQFPFTTLKSEGCVAMEGTNTTVTFATALVAQPLRLVTTT